MTLSEAFRALFPNWRKPHGPIPDREIEGRRINETERARLERISKLPR